jgi:hypothetical protein
MVEAPRIDNVIGHAGAALDGYMNAPALAASHGCGTTIAGRP